MEHHKSRKWWPAYYCDQDDLFLSAQVTAVFRVKQCFQHTSLVRGPFVILLGLLRKVALIEEVKGE